MTPEQEESIIKEALEFQFPSQALKTYQYLRMFTIAVLAILAVLFVAFLLKGHKSVIEEHEYKTLDPINRIEDFLSDSPYFMVLKNLGAKRYRFVILKETESPGVGKLATGYFDSSTFSDFFEQFHEGQEQVGFIYVGSKSSEQLYQIVYAPNGTDVKTILAKVNAPSDPAALSELGLNNIKMLVASSIQDIKEAQIVADSTPIIFADLGSEYSGLFKDLSSGKYKWITLKHDPNNFSKIKVSRGADQDFSKIQSSFQDGQEQVTFAWVGADDNAETVMIVYAPGSSYATMCKQVISGFHLPSTSAALANLGLDSTKIYVASKTSDITEQAALGQAKDDGLSSS